MYILHAAVLHLHAAVLHLHAAVLHLHVAVLHLHAAVLHLQYLKQFVAHCFYLLIIALTHIERHHELPEDGQELRLKPVGAIISK